MRKPVIVLNLLLLLSFITQAQHFRNPVDATTGTELQQIFQNNYVLTESRIRELAQQNQVQLRYEFPSGLIREIVDISPTGLALYRQTTNNLDAAKTISTNKVWPGGTAGLSLTGAGMTGRIGVWDGGAVRTTHQEFQSRAVQTDGSPSLSSHATHVAGTMVAGGVSANAKGMSYQAPIKCYDWSNDASEMSSAANAGMLVSNHSYSLTSGWSYNSSLGRWQWYGDISVSDQEDYKYGFYDNGSQGIDQIVINYPNYLPFYAAGNDRGEPGTIPSTFYVQQGFGNWVLGNASNPPNVVGPYNCISGGPANAKNVLTVGAVNAIPAGYSTPSGVVMSSFSGWGPTDDGRIKPDVVADGVNVYSSNSTSNTSYLTQSGTSMATPNASGSALLIQQHYNNLKGGFMRASTLKGLIIHTADEAGAATGPDYRFGWGLMNTSKATAVITDSSKNAIIQSSLSSFGSFTYTIFTDGTTPIRATICWTDRPGTPTSPILNPTTKMLVNDLDIRVKRNSDNTNYFPYVLNPASPANAATTGDNNTDNVEQVYIATTTPGTYTITVTPKGTISGGSQQFALIVSGIMPKPTAAFTVTSKVICAARSVTYTDQSSGANSRMWYFPGGTPATSTVANPTVTYYNPGTYPVALRISNPSGYDSIYMDDYINVGGLSLPFTENFESNSPTRGLWTVENLNADTTFRLWTIGGTAPGNTAYGINNFDKPTTNLYDRIVSPILDLRGYQNVALDFQHAYTRYDSLTSDSLIIWVSTNCGSNYTRVVGFGENDKGSFATAPDSTFLSPNRFIPASASDWCGNGIGASCKSVDLSAFTGNANVRIRMEQRSGKGNNMFLDNIRVTGVPHSPVANFYSMTRTVCVGAELQMLDSSLNNPDEYTWYFEDGDTAISNARNPKVSFLTPGTKSISLVVSNASGGDSIGKINYITVLPSPTVPMLSSSKGQILCDGDSTTLSTDATSNFAWYKNGIAFSTTLTSFTVKEESNYFVRSFGTNGCNSNSPKVDILAGITPAKPVITKDLTGVVFCEGGSFNLYSSSVINNQWFLNDTLFTGKTGNSLAYNETGKFMVRVNDKTCYNFSEPMTITKLPRPQTSLISGAGWGVKGSTENFSVTRGISGSTLNWSVIGGTIQSGAGTTDVVVEFGTGSNATVNVQEVASNCSGQLRSMQVTLVNTGVNHLGKQNQLTVYPNPTADQIAIRIQAPVKTQRTISVYNLMGKLVLQETSSEAQVVTDPVVNVRALSSGIYLMRISQDDQEYLARFIRE